MRKNDLCNAIRPEYTAERGFGTTRVDDPEYRNIWFVVPPPPPTAAPVSLPKVALKRAHKALNQIPEMGSEDELDKFVALLFQRREALTSSRMEGTWSTIDHVMTPKEHLESPNAKSATASVRGYADALESNFAKVLKQGYGVFSLAFVKSLHKTIVSKDPTFDGTPGALRTPGKHRSIVLIGGLRKENSVYNPAPPEHVDRCFKEVLSWYRDDLQAELGDIGHNGMTLPIRLALGHCHFEAVHPFQDGNGRVGRMLWPFQMVLSGMSPLYLSGFVEANKTEYAKSLGTAQKKLDYGPLIEFMCEAISESHEEAEKTKQALLELPSAWSQRAKFRKNSTAERSLRLLIKSPIVTAAELKNELDVSFQAANAALKSLVDGKIVQERTGNARNRIFAAEEVLALVGRAFGEDTMSALKRSRNQMLGS